MTELNDKSCLPLYFIILTTLNCVTVILYPTDTLSYMPMGLVLYFFYECRDISTGFYIEI